MEDFLFKPPFLVDLGPAAERGFKVLDLVILDAVHDWLCDKEENRIMIGGVVYVAITPKKLIEELPVLRMGERAARRTLERLTDSNLFSRKAIINSGGAMMYYTLGSTYFEMGGDFEPDTNLPEYERPESNPTGRSDPGITGWRKKVFEKDGNMCRLCGSKENLVVHHVIPYADAPNLRCDVNNGTTLCWNCHMRFHGGRKNG